MPDPFEALGYGKDLYSYRGPYYQFIHQETPAGQLKVDDGSSSAAAAGAAEIQAREQEFSAAVARAAAVIGAADYLLVCAGAGLSADSGLGTYADVASRPAWQAKGFTYGSLCLPSLLEEQPKVSPYTQKRSMRLGKLL
jgi:hypothetical protein